LSEEFSSDTIHVVAIAGTGLIGGSFGMALRAAEFEGEILGIKFPASIERALRHGAIDRAATLEEAAARADLPLSLAARRPDPHHQFANFRRCSESGRWSPMSAVPKHANRRGRPQISAARKFIGGHPMAGSEARGVEHAVPDLFCNRTWVLTPLRPKTSTNPVVRDLRVGFSRIGARELVMGAEEHDYRVAYGSHLPQLASTALASSLSETETLTGPGARGMTRLGSAPSTSGETFSPPTPVPSKSFDRLYPEAGAHRENLRTTPVEEEFGRAAGFARGLE